MAAQCPTDIHHQVIVDSDVESRPSPWHRTAGSNRPRTHDNSEIGIRREIRNFNTSLKAHTDLGESEILTDLWKLSATEAVALLRKGEASPMDMVDAAAIVKAGAIIPR